MARKADRQAWEPGLDEEAALRPKPAATVEKVLTIVLGLLVLALVAGSIYGLATGSRERKLAREAAVAALPAGSEVFTAVGTIRAQTRDKPPSVVVATIAFPYPAGDAPFAEELEKKTDALRAAAKAWFAERGAADLVPAYEGSVKAGLRDAFNEVLALGKIEELWLSDFSVIQ